MLKDKRLGRGLEALLGKVAAIENDAQLAVQQTGQSISVQQTIPMVDEPEGLLPQSLRSRPPQCVSVEQIDRNPYQPRTDFDTAEIDTLAASLKTHGLVQPIVVRPQNDRYEIVAGERRFRAAIAAGWTEVPVHLLTVDDRQMAELALTENIQRKDLNAMEKAAAFARYLETYGSTHDELAKRLELDRSTVSNLLRLLELPDVIQTAIRQGTVSQGHARALLPLKEKGHEQEQLDIFHRIQTEGWNVRQTEKFVKEMLEPTTDFHTEWDSRVSSDSDSETDDTRGGSWNVIGEDGVAKTAVGGMSGGGSGTNPHLQALEQEFRSCLGTKVRLAAKGGKGKIVIPFANHAEFERLFQLICKQPVSRARG